MLPLVRASHQGHCIVCPCLRVNVRGGGGPESTGQYPVTAGSGSTGGVQSAPDALDLHAVNLQVPGSENVPTGSIQRTEPRMGVAHLGSQVFYGGHCGDQRIARTLVLLDDGSGHKRLGLTAAVLAVPGGITPFAKAPITLTIPPCTIRRGSRVIKIDQ